MADDTPSISPFECIVCTSEYTNEGVHAPYILKACAHTLCKTCIDDLWRKGRQEILRLSVIACPFCRQASCYKKDARPLPNFALCTIIVERTTSHATSKPTPCHRVAPVYSSNRTIFRELGSRIGGAVINGAYVNFRDYERRRMCGSTVWTDLMQLGAVARVGIYPCGEHHQLETGYIAIAIEFGHAVKSVKDWRYHVTVVARVGKFMKVEPTAAGTVIEVTRERPMVYVHNITCPLTFKRHIHDGRLEFGAAIYFY